MISTGVELETFITSLNAEADIDATLWDVLVDNGRAILEEERPWVKLRKTDSSLSVTSGNTWQTAIDLSGITDFSRFYAAEDDAPIKLFDGNNRVERYYLKPLDMRLDYKDISNTAIYDANGDTLYLNGNVPFSGTLHIDYVASSGAIDLTSSSEVWTPFPRRFLPILGYYAIGIYKGAVDYDNINRQMLPENRETLNALKMAMEAWDNELQHANLVSNDPTEFGAFPRSGAINRHI